VSSSTFTGVNHSMKVKETRRSPGYQAHHLVEPCHPQKVGLVQWVASPLKQSYSLQATMPRREATNRHITAKEARDPVSSTTLNRLTSRLGHLNRCSWNPVEALLGGVCRGKYRWIVTTTVAAIGQAGKITMTELSYISSLPLVYQHLPDLVTYILAINIAKISG
jgi:hypothetical protein